jgi:hypothetical protein
LPYYTGFDNTNEKAGWQEFRQGYQGFYNWGYGSGFTAPYSISHDYPVGSTSTDTTIDWFVSPQFDFTNGGMIDSIKVRIYSITGNVTAIDYLGAYLLIGSSNPSTATSKIELGNFTSLVYNNGNWSDTGKFTIPASTNNCYIGIKYRATNNWFVVGVDNIKISGNSSSGIKNITQSNYILSYPNPCTNEIQINSKNRIQSIAITNVLGNSINWNWKNEANTNYVILDTEQLSKGIYFVRLIDKSGVVYLSKFVKE